MELPRTVISESYSVRGSVVLTRTGSVIEVEHEKFLLVVAKDARGFIALCTINTKSRRHGLAQVGITPKDLPCLSHDSFVNCANVVFVEEARFSKSLDEGVFIPKGHIGQDVIERVLEAGRNCRLLKPFEREFFE